MNAGTQKKNRKIFCIAAVCLCVIACTVGDVYAYLMDKTDPLSNEFVPAKVSCDVEENFLDGVKSSVKVRNTGNIDAYIRTAVVATFVSEDGKVHSSAPVENVNYSITWGTDGWVKGTDDFWYHTKPVAPEETTTSLIETAHGVSAPEGYRLHIQILATAIQSVPDDVVQEAWGVTINNGDLIPN